jgi:hypothetical protein
MLQTFAQHTRRGVIWEKQGCKPFVSLALVAILCSLATCDHTRVLTEKLGFR